MPVSYEDAQFPKHALLALTKGLAAGVRAGHVAIPLVITTNLRPGHFCRMAERNAD
jgi:hypothetical protein